ncbi:hypothetical protein SDRG_14866 [Saprolegnia diclina VS20]|uniref:Uncharacterized protein n=1 Tax=Saprolegnia diclina (strain VS20) TaxID=1156394 RepID=T0RCN0_SAPDV|nr:hypothetical protein SDRG_14866 [Saprolegnia diclina VS20]EQC27342.1 hypothetical protein SDRG_14866 [Saprolegnia diclina VS20]|eukprot:XP_008619246.1 hypothetical protein SDRG_14866 [Saprolegnia diclina VS20]
MVRARRRRQTGASKLASYQSSLALRAEVAATVAELRCEATAASFQESVRVPLRLRPRSVVATPEPVAAITRLAMDRTPDVALVFAKTHVIHQAQPSLADICLHAIADQFDCLDEACDDTRAALGMLPPSQLARLSVLATWYKRWTHAAQVTLLGTPTIESLCVGSLSLQAVLPLLSPRSDMAVDDDASWEDATEISVTWHGCPRLRSLELVQCRSLTGAVFEAFPALEHFALVGNSEFDAIDANLLLLLPMSLQTLSVLGCPWLTTDKVLAFMRQRQSLLKGAHLTCVRLLECHRVDSQVVHRLWRQHLPTVQLVLD